MKHIGFVDFFLDEWHANNYPAWILKNALDKGRKVDVSYAWAGKGKPGGLDTVGWCTKFGVQPLGSVEELVEKSDCIIVLSPDNPEQHEKLARLPLMSGKPVYVDKTFSPDLASGLRMFELALKHGTPMFSSSALRFAQELAAYPDEKVNRSTLEHVATMGPGIFENYSVHQLEMIAALMGVGAKRVKSLSSGNGKLLAADYGDGRRFSLLQMQHLPFQVSIQLKNGEGVFISECSNIFERLIDAILEFFETGKPPVPREETLEIMALREAGLKTLLRYDTWVEVPKI